MTPVYRHGRPEDAARVRATYLESFDAIFRHLYAPEDYNLFVADHSEAAFAAQLADPAYAFRLAEVGDRLIGYAKLGPPKLPYDASGRVCLDLYQLYLLEDAKGSGVATVLMDWVIAEAKRRGAAELWLSVFSENPRARRFYARYGFEEVRQFKFMVGNHADDEFLCRMVL